MQGRRLPDNADPRETVPGDYYFSTWTGRRWLEFRDPCGNHGRVLTHKVEEHDDGTVSVAPSILDMDDGGYHGYLTRGVWDP